MTRPPIPSPDDATERHSKDSGVATDSAHPTILIHTVKNNLQVLHSLCSLHSRSINDKTALSAFSRIRGGLLLFAEAYDLLYRSDQTDLINLGPFFQKIISRFASLYLFGGSPWRASSLIPEISVCFSTAVSWGLLLNEVIGHLASSLSNTSLSSELSAIGALEESCLAITFRLPSPSTDNCSENPSPAPQMPTDIGPVGTALLRQCEGSLIWITHLPASLKVVLPLPETISS